MVFVALVYKNSDQNVLINDLIHPLWDKILIEMIGYYNVLHIHNIVCWWLSVATYSLEHAYN